MKNVTLAQARIKLETGRATGQFAGMALTDNEVELIMDRLAKEFPTHEAVVPLDRVAKLAKHLLKKRA